MPNSMLELDAKATMPSSSADCSLLIAGKKWGGDLPFLVFLGGQFRLRVVLVVVPPACLLASPAPPALKRAPLLQSQGSRSKWSGGGSGSTQHKKAIQQRCRGEGQRARAQAAHDCYIAAMTSANPKWQSEELGLIID